MLGNLPCTRRTAARSRALCRSTGPSRDGTPPTGSRYHDTGRLGREGGGGALPLTDSTKRSNPNAGWLRLREGPRFYTYEPLKDIQVSADKDLSKRHRFCDTA